MRFLFALIATFGFALPVYAQSKSGIARSDEALLQQAERLAKQPDRVQDAVALANQVYQSRARELGLEHQETALALVTLAITARAAGNQLQAIEHYESALKVFERLGIQDLKVAQTHYSLAMVFVLRSVYPAAITHLEKAYAIEERLLGKNAPTLAMTLRTLGLCHLILDQPDRALPYLEQALHLCEQQSQVDSNLMSHLLLDLGRVQTRLQNFAQAKDLLIDALKLQVQVHGEQHVETAQVILNLGVLASRAGDYALADQTLAHAESIYRKNAENKATELGEVLLHRAQIQRLLGNFSKAKEQFEKSAAIYEQAYGEDQTSTAEALYGAAESAFLAGEIPAAIASCDRARRITRNYMVRNLPYLPEKDQLEFILSQDAYRLDEILNAVQLLVSDPQIAEVSANWILNSQGSANEALTEQFRKFKQYSDPQQRARLIELQTIRQKLAKWSLATALADQSIGDVEIKRLREREKTLSQQLITASIDTDDQDRWVEVKQIQSQLKPDECYWQFARFQRFDFNSGAFLDSHRYLAWTVHSEGPVQLFDLGDAEVIDQQIAKARNRIASSTQKSSTLMQQGEPAALVELNRELEQLKQLLFTPLAATLKGKTHLWISPDASLWLTPWGALPLNNETFLIESMSIQLLNSGRELLQRETTLPEMRPAVLFANPRFDLSPRELGKAVPRSDTGGLASVENPSLLKNPATAKTISFDRIIPLPNTQVEAEVISPSLQALTGFEPIAYFGEQAQESVALSAKQPSILLMGTHGFLLPDTQVQNRGGLSTELNPLVRCGLLLAGCQHPQARSGTALDDGVLTGLEIVSMDLHGTGLVILSACDTGIGSVRNGEGVASLCQAFRLAGARGVVSTLWQIPDRDSALLIKRFVEELSQGKPKAAALQLAQRERIEKRRERFGAAHPLFWSAFQITGL